MIWYPDKRAVNMKVKDPVVNNLWRRFLRPLSAAELLPGWAGTAKTQQPGHSLRRRPELGRAAGLKLDPPPGLAPADRGQDGAVRTGVPVPSRPRRVTIRSVAGGPAGRHGLLLACYLAAGVAVTGLRVSYLAGRLPALRDTGGYVWGFWWIAHQVTHLGNPWSTSYLAAPAGTQLGFHTLMPLPGLLMAPVTLAFGPSASYNLLAIASPGLLCYAMYRAARLWLPSGVDSVLAGAFFGLSASLDWRSWYQLNLALGALFLPMALEAAVRLRRDPDRRHAVILGLVLAAALLTDQQSAVLATIVAALALIPWLAGRPSRLKIRRAALAATVGAGVASPQLLAMARQAAAGAASAPAHLLAANYSGSGAGMVQMFAPSPRLASYGLTSLASPYYHGRPSIAVAGYGMVLSLLAVTGLAVAWRRASARQLALLWLGASLLALGSRPWVWNRPYLPLGHVWQGVPTSQLMPFSWFVRLPGMANMQEANRFTGLGLLAAALLAGAAVGWLRCHAKPVLAALLALGLMEAGWSGNPAGHRPIGAMPTAMSRLDGPIAADRSGSIVVDVPFGIRGGLEEFGQPFPPETMVLATADGHPLGDGLIARVPSATMARISRRPFYAALMNAQRGRPNSAGLQRAAAASARSMHIGWVLVWVRSAAVSRFLEQAGFRLAYQADGVLVYRPAGQPPSGPAARPRG
jgi:hypothetical protein